MYPLAPILLTMPIYQLADRLPHIDYSAYVAESADIIGSVTLLENSSVWFHAVLRGDNEPITIGRNSNVQEGAVLHTDPGCPLDIGDNVTIGHQAMLHGCTIGEGSLVGIQAVVLNRAVIGRYCLVGAGALITEGKQFPDYSLILGSPARVVRTLGEDDLALLRRSAEIYARRGHHYKDALKRLT